MRMDGWRVRKGGREGERKRGREERRDDETEVISEERGQHS